MSGRESLQHEVIEKGKKEILMAQDGDNKRRGKGGLSRPRQARAAGERGKQGQRVLKALFSAVEKKKEGGRSGGVEWRRKKKAAIG